MIQRTPEELQPLAQSALAESPIYALRNLKVDCAGHALSLHGSVMSYYHKQLAQEAVRTVARGIELINSISVEPLGPNDSLEG